MSRSMKDLPAVLLVGGLGTRLRPAVASQPKALATVGGRPFLELLVKQLTAQGIRELVMCTGYLADQIEQTFGDGSRFGAVIRYSKEDIPIGTGGALKLAEIYLKGVSDFLVLNGDSFLELDFEDFQAFHRGKNAVATLAATEVANAGRYGTVQIGESGRIEAFREKTGEEKPGLVNAGVYLFARSVLTEIPEGPSSLEKDIFPRLLKQGMFAWKQKGMFIDIGTPEDYERAKTISDRLKQAAHSPAIES